MNEVISQQLVRLSMEAISVLVPIIIAILANNLKNHAQNQKLIRMKHVIENKQLVAKDAVIFAQQVFKHCDGEEKYSAAIEILAANLKRYGIKVEKEELDELVHTALKSAKKEFGDVWNTIGTGKPDNGNEAFGNDNAAQ